MLRVMSDTSATSVHTLVGSEGSMPASGGLTEAEVHAVTGSEGGIAASAARELAGTSVVGLVGREDSMMAQVDSSESEPED
jgi:hypothetical protein